MNTISLIGLLVIVACFVLTMVSLRRWYDELQRWDNELRTFQDATMDMLADTSLDVSRLQKRVETLEETAAALCERADKLDEEHAEQVEQALQMAQDFSNGVSNLMNYSYLMAGKKDVSDDA